VKELGALRAVFAERNGVPAFNSTKSLAGHSLGATGVHEAIYTLLMMENKFISASANVENVDPEVGDLPLVTERQDNVDINCALSNSFGFGGTNASLAFKTLQD
jgi:3-oxoacyl-[acyl-carrier-protein] synthase-1